MPDEQATEIERRRVLHCEHQRKYRRKHAKAIQGRQREHNRKYRLANAEAIRAQNHEYRRNNMDAIRAYKCEYRPIRRAREKGVYTESVDPIEVFTRDKWRCRTCKCKTPKELSGSNEPNAPTLDHIVPVSLGGPHTKSNLQCACRHCNGIKCAKFSGQLAFA